MAPFEVDGCAEPCLGTRQLDRVPKWVSSMVTTIEQAFDEFAETLTTPSGETSAEAGHRASIKQCLENQFGMTHFFQSGSFGFGTNVPGQSDVDRFAVIPTGNISPNSWMALRQIAAALRGRFSDTKVVTDNPAIRISFYSGADATEVIPALDVTPHGSSGHRIFGISDGKGGWTQSSPESHKELISKVDEKVRRQTQAAYSVCQSVEIS